jgi:V8-like Glu-specific endopeptidase
MPAQLQFPWRTICFLESFFRDETDGGSGVLIRNDTVLTAGHCVFRDRQEADRIRVSPGAYLSAAGNIVRPQLAWARPANYHFVDEWRAESESENIGSNFDYALIILPPDQAFDGSAVGNMAASRVSAADLNANIFHLAGYPAEYGTVGQQYQGMGKLANWDNNRLYYYFGTQGGESGSPVYYLAPQQQGDGTTVDVPIVAGIHTTRFNNGVDSSIRINATVMQNLKTWMA